MASVDILRYPLEMIGDSTDYLQIIIKESIKDGLVKQSPISNSINKVTAGGSNSVSFEPSSLITSVIVLPMPSNIQDGNSVGYSDDSLNGFAAAALGPITDMLDGSVSGIAYPDLRNLAGDFVGTLSEMVTDPAARRAINRYFAAAAVNVFGTNVTPQQLLARETGQIFNPNMELLFNNVTLRNFKFSFKITPRSKDEADGVKSIIRTLKTYMAPSFESSYFLKTPKTFELYFKTGNSDHKFLNRFKPCFLTDMAVNYTAENVYSTLPGGEPVSMIMDLSFKEIEPIYQGDYDTDEGKIGVGY